MLEGPRYTGISPIEFGFLILLVLSAFAKVLKTHGHLYSTGCCCWCVPLIPEISRLTSPGLNWCSVLLNPIGKNGYLLQWILEGSKGLLKSGHCGCDVHGLFHQTCPSCSGLLIYHWRNLSFFSQRRDWSWMLQPCAVKQTAALFTGYSVINVGS